MNLFAFTGLVNAIFALSLGILIIARGWRDRTNQLFFFMTMAVALWGFGYWRWLLATEYDVALFWVRVLSVGSLFIPIFYFHWCVTLFNINVRIRFLFHGIYSVALLILAASASPLFIRALEPALAFPFWPRAGILYSLYLLFIYAGLIFFAVYLMARHYRYAPNEERGQIFYILLGSLFGFVGGATNFFLWYDIPIAPYGSILVALFPFFLGYAVVKHHLFDVRVVATELLVFAIWLFLLIRGVLAATPTDRYLNFGLLVLVIVFGVFLIRSIWREVEQRERIEALAGELADANEALKKLDAAKSEFISIASHQLRAPLTVIKGYVSLFLEGSFGAVTEQAKEAMKKVAISAEQLVKLIADMLDLSRIESGRLKYTMKPIVLDDIVDEAVKEFEVNAKAKGLSFIYQNRNTAKQSVNADSDKLREVVVNLIDNAIKYTAAGRVAIELYSEASNAKRWLTLKVQDSGMGIASADISKMFTKFGRTEEARRVRPDGMGLGLYLVKKIIDDHGGQVRVESAGLGKGSTFYVQLPITGPVS
jgi:signal transduction histidine kinase